MIAFKNIKTNSIRIFGNISDTPRLYAETIAKTSANKELKPEEIEWELIENYEPPKEPEPPKPTYEQLVVAKIRSKYSLDEELAIQRQRDTKPQEFADYNAFCEQCKTKAKKEI